METTRYNENFFSRHEQGSRNSARAMIPLIFEYVRPASVVDVGCGVGAWLAEFAAAGVTDYLGIDGDYVDREQLLIDRQRFQAHDLSEPLGLDRRFDLAVSLEVAEHLPPERAATFVKSLTRLAPVILFSAAIPHQGGVDHVNEQWPEYWQEAFLRQDYVAVDCLRARLWDNDLVMHWYRQNTFFYVDRGRLADYPRLASAFEQPGQRSSLSLVHRDYYLALYSKMIRKIHESQCLALRYALRLRDINLLAFPDWSQPADHVAAELQLLFTAIKAHRDQARVALVFDVSNASEELSRTVITQSVRAVFPLDGAAPEIAAVDAAFGPEHWEVLLAIVQGRVQLPHENAQALTASGAQQLPVVSLASIQDQQPLVRQ